MDKKLAARVQKLSKKLPQNAQSFSSALVIDPDDQESLEKRGTLYAVYDISGGTPLDPLLVTKIIHDVLHDSYYSSETVSPIQSLEKAIVNVRDKVTELPDTASNGMMDFNILAAALWGNVLYMVQFGKGGSFLVREGEVKPVNTATEGNFSEASGVVRGDDVVILGTETFISKFTPEELVTGAVSFSVTDLPEKASALLIKFEATSEFTEEEKIDFGLKDSPANQTPPQKRSKPVNKIKDTTLSIAKKVPSNLPKITLRSTKRSRVKPIHLVIIVVVFLLGGSIYWTLRSRDIPLEEQTGEPSLEEVLVEESSEEPDVSKDEEFKINRVDTEVFYDIKIVDEGASPTGIAVLDNLVMVVDSNSGKLFSSGIVTPSFDAEESSFDGVSFPSYFAGDLIFKDSEGFKVYDSGAVSESYDSSELGPLAAYLSFVYSVSGDKITKYSKGDGELSGSIWAQSSDLEGAVSIAIDGSIYVLKSDGSLLRLLSGENDGFEVLGLDRPFSNPANIVKDIDLENIYVADSGNKRIVVLDEDGNLVSQYIANDDSWDDIRGVGVTRDEKTLFVLSGSRVYTVER